MHIELRVNAGADNWFFLTLTLGSEYRATSQGYGALKRLWNNLRMYLTRKRGKYEYVAFIEGQQRRGGMPHFHVLLSIEPPNVRGKRGTITGHAVHAFARKRGFGYEAALEMVNSKRASWYVSKYASKGDPATPKGFRRVRSSRGFYKLPRKLPLVVPAKGEDLAHFLVRVHEITNVNLEELSERWQAIQAVFAEETE